MPLGITAGRKCKQSDLRDFQGFDGFRDGPAGGIIAFSWVIRLVGETIIVSIPVVVRAFEEGIIGGEDDDMGSVGTPRKILGGGVEGIQRVFLANGVLHRGSTETVPRITIGIGEVGSMEFEGVAQRLGIEVDSIAILDTPKSMT